MTKLNTIIEAVGEAYEDLRVDYDPPAMYLIAGIAATGAERDELLGAVMQSQPNLDPLTQCRLAAGITARLAIAEALPLSRSAPRRRPAAEVSHSHRPANSEMTFTAPHHGVLSVNGRRLRD